MRNTGFKKTYEFDLDVSKNILFRVNFFYRLAMSEQVRLEQPNKI